MVITLKGQFTDLLLNLLHFFSLAEASSVSLNPKCPTQFSMAVEICFWLVQTFANTRWDSVAFLANYLPLLKPAISAFYYWFFLFYLIGQIWYSVSVLVQSTFTLIPPFDQISIEFLLVLTHFLINFSLQCLFQPFLVTFYPVHSFIRVFTRLITLTLLHFNQPLAWDLLYPPRVWFKYSNFRWGPTS